MCVCLKQEATFYISPNNKLHKTTSCKPQHDHRFFYVYTYCLHCQSFTQVIPIQVKMYACLGFSFNDSAQLIQEISQPF